MYHQLNNCSILINFSPDQDTAFFVLKYNAPSYKNMKYIIFLFDIPYQILFVS